MVHNSTKVLIWSELKSWGHLNQKFVVADAAIPRPVKPLHQTAQVLIRNIHLLRCKEFSQLYGLSV